MAEGTVLIKVTSFAAGKSRNAKALSARMIFPPQDKGTNISNTERSKQIEVEKSTPEISFEVNTSLAHETKATALQCSRATPLGWPVEPEVYRT